MKLLAWSVYQIVPSFATAGSWGKFPGRGILYSTIVGAARRAGVRPAAPAATIRAKMRIGVSSRILLQRTTWAGRRFPERHEVSGEHVLHAPPLTSFDRIGSARL